MFNFFGFGGDKVKKVVAAGAIVAAEAMSPTPADAQVPNHDSPIINTDKSVPDIGENNYESPISTDVNQNYVEPIITDDGNLDKKYSVESEPKTIN